MKTYTYHYLPKSHFTYHLVKTTPITEIKKSENDFLSKVYWIFNNDKKQRSILFFVKQKIKSIEKKNLVKVSTCI